MPVTKNVGANRNEPATKPTGRDQCFSRAGGKALNRCRRFK
jgi:hypothetical protein